MVEGLVFIGAGAGVGAGDKNTQIWSRSKTDRLRNTDDRNRILILKFSSLKCYTLLKHLNYVQN